MSDILTTRDGDILVVTLNRPAKKNALTGDMYNGMSAALDQAKDDHSIGTIVFEGSGGSFTAGNDLADFLQSASDFTQSPALNFIRRLAVCETPIVAAVDGVAVGIGTTMLFHCDLVYAAPQAKFRMPFVDLGLVPEAGSSLLVPQRVGTVRATELLMLGEGFDAQAALGFGIINAIVPTEDLRGVAMDKAHRLAVRPRAALRETRRLMRGDLAPLLARMEDEAQAFGAALQSKDAKAALSAFMDRNKRA